MRLAPVLLVLGVTACGQPPAGPPPGALAAAAAAGDLATVLTLLDQGVSPADTGTDGTLPLVEAVLSRHPAVVSELLAAGADPLSPDGRGVNAWDAVMHRGDAAIADTLLRRTVRDAGGGGQVAAWFVAVAGRGTTVPAWQEILNGELLSLGLMAAALHDRADVIRTMRPAREVPNRTGYHALALAARWGRVSATEALLAIDVHPDLVTARRTTALAEAARDGHLAVLRRLLAHRADPDHADLNGDTPLHWARRHGQLAYADVLLRAGADPRRRNLAGRIPAETTVRDARRP